MSCGGRRQGRSSWAHVGLGRDLKVLQVLLSVEGDSARLDLALLDVHLVAAEHDRNRLANTPEDERRKGGGHELDIDSASPGQGNRTHSRSLCQLGTFL